MSKQSQAFNYLFLTIMEENGYYDNLRRFMRKRGYNYADMASMLNNAYDDAPDGLSVYWYMDSLENMLTEHTIRGFKDIDDMVDYVNDHMMWKEY